MIAKDRNKNDGDKKAVIWYAKAAVKMQRFVIMLVFPVLTFGFFGYLLDKRLNTQNILMLIMSIVGFVVSIYIVFREINGKTDKGK